MPENYPPDPWGRCHCRPKRPPTTAPRLAAFVSSVVGGLGYGGVVHLTAALWGGHYARTVPLSVEQARLLAAELHAHADALERDSGGSAAAAAARGGDARPPRSAGPAHGYWRPRRRVRPTGAVGSPS